jgi:hypothetical protein
VFSRDTISNLIEENLDIMSYYDGQLLDTFNLRIDTSQNGAFYNVNSIKNDSLEMINFSYNNYSNNLSTNWIIYSKNGNAFQSKTFQWAESAGHAIRKINNLNNTEYIGYGTRLDNDKTIPNAIVFSSEFDSLRSFSMDIFNYSNSMYNVEKLNDNRYLLFGYLNNWVPFEPLNCTFRNTMTVVDTLGNVISNWINPRNYSQAASAVANSSDGNVIMDYYEGYSENMNSWYVKKSYIIKTDTDGNEIWRFVIDGFDDSFEWFDTKITVI